MFVIPDAYDTRWINEGNGKRKCTNEGNKRSENMEIKNEGNQKRKGVNEENQKESYHKQRKY